MSLRLRFALWIGSVATGVLVLVAFASFQVLVAFLQQDGAERLRVIMQTIEIDVDDGEVELESELPADVHYRILVQGRVAEQDGSFPEVPIDLTDPYTRWSDHQVLMERRKEDNVAYEVHLATDASDIMEPLAAYTRAESVILPFAAILLALTSWILAARLTAPLARLEKVTSNLGPIDSASERIPGVERNDEIGRLARTIQDATSRLADAVRRERAFTQAAAHDLRSPLAAIRTRLQSILTGPRDEATYIDTLREIDVDVERLATLTNHLLLLARDPAHIKRTPVNLTAIAASAVDRARERAPDVSIDFTGSDAPDVLGDETLLASVVHNLLDNAVQHGLGADNRVEISVNHDRDVQLLVADEGPGVAADLLNEIQKPFVQVSSARNLGGSGLGLAVVTSLVTAMGGSIDFTSQTGAGFCATVRLRCT